MRDAGIEEPEDEEEDDDDNQGGPDEKKSTSTDAVALLDMTLSAVTMGTSNRGSSKLKRLNDFERETAKVLRLNQDLLQREDISMKAVA